MFDPHWHARDGVQRHKETVEHSLRVAYAAGLDAIAAMPNTAPPLVDLDSCRNYLKLTEGSNVPVRFYVHIGLTPDVEQVKRAVEAWRQEPRIIGMKAYWGRSTGNLGIVDRNDQFRVLNVLAEEGYTGVLVSHCEKEAEMDDTAYDPKNPRTWSTLARPESAEIQSFRDIFLAATVARFRGTVHVAHVSTTEVVDTIHDYNQNLTQDDVGDTVLLSCGITPHHLFLDYTKLDDPQTGPWYKCNPPLRSPETQQRLLQRLLEGKIPIIESDHAPHTKDDKNQGMPASGLASGTAWPFVVEHLKQLGMSKERVREVTFENAVRLYGLGGDLRVFGYERRDPNLQVLKALQGDYPHDPFVDMFKVED